MRVKGTENSRPTAPMRVSWAGLLEPFPGKCSRDDRAPEKQKLISLVAIQADYHKIG